MSEDVTFQAVPVVTAPMRIVVIAAHHDDIEFGVGGSVAKWIQEGAEVTYVIVTDGSAGSNDPDVTPDALIVTRKREQLQAATVVGVKDIRFLGYKDGELQPTIELRRDLTRIIRELKPFRVVCQNPETIFYGESYINHPDHRAAGEAAAYAVFPSAESRPIFAELLEEGYEPHKVSELFMTLSPDATHYVDISGFLDKKIESLRAHVSQLGEGEHFENGAAMFTEKRNGEAGQRVGVKYAEFFKVMTLRRPDDAQSATEE